MASQQVTILSIDFDEFYQNSKFQIPIENFESTNNWFVCFSFFFFFAISFPSFLSLCLFLTFNSEYLMKVISIVDHNVHSISLFQSFSMRSHTDGFVSESWSMKIVWDLAFGLIVLTCNTLSTTDLLLTISRWHFMDV